MTDVKSSGVIELLYEDEFDSILKLEERKTPGAESRGFGDRSVSCGLLVVREQGPRYPILMPGPDASMLAQNLAAVHPDTVDSSEIRTAFNNSIDLIRCNLGLFIEVDEPVEIRVVSKNGKLTAQMFPDAAKAAVWAAAQGARNGVQAVYFGFNPIDLDALKTDQGRGPRHHLKAKTVCDRHVARRTWLLVDLDPIRPADTSATDAEKDLALDRARVIRNDLVARGWPEPVFCDSGNGGHLMFRIDLPADEGGLVQRVLQSLARRHDDDAVKVDVSVYNPSRITKVYGTYARKGPSTPLRPHRRSEILQRPDEIEAVPEKLLEDLAAESSPKVGPPPTPKTDTHQAASGSPNAYDIWNLAATGNARPGPEQRAIDYMDGIPGAIAGEGGHTQTLKAAIAIGPGFDLSPETTLRLLQSYNLRCQPAWSERELLHKVEDAFKKEPRRGFLRDQDRPEWNPSEGGSVSFVSSPGSTSEKNGPPPDPSEGGSVSFVSGLGEPLPILTALRQVPLMEPGMLPVAIADWLSDVCDRMKSPLDFAAAGWIVSLSSVVGRKMAVRPKRHDDWSVPMNLWGAIVGRPGVMKTPVLTEVMKPINRLAVRAQQRFELESKSSQIRSVIGEASAKAAKSELEAKARGKSKPGSNVTDEELAEIASRIASSKDVEDPVERRYVVNDSTVEKLGELLIDNPNGLLHFRDELIGWLRGMERSGHEQDRGFYLESWNATGGYVWDRIGRGTIKIPNCCLSVLGGIQPGPLGTYLRAAMSGQTESDCGLMQRFQVLVFPDVVPFDIVDRRPHSGYRDRAYDVFDSLDAATPERFDAEIDEYDPDKVPFLRFSPEAQEVFYAWLYDIETRIRSGNENAAFESHLSKYKSLFVKLAGLFHMVSVVTRECDKGPVSYEATLMAQSWVVYLEEHARRVYESALNSDAEPARRLAEQLKKGTFKSPFMARDVYRKCWSGLDDAQSAERALNILEDRWWVKSQEVPTTQRGGRPNTIWHINPKVWNAQAGD